MTKINISNHTIIFQIILLVASLMFISSTKRLFSSMRFMTGHTASIARGTLPITLHPIQTMYESLKSIPTSPSSEFHHAINSPHLNPNIATCLEAMNRVSLSDLGYEPEDIDILDESVCGTISSTRQFNIAVFLIPKGHCLPLHDHPSMTVLSKVIYGDLEMKSYSILRKPSDGEVSIDGVQRGEIVVQNNAIAAKFSQSLIKTSEDPSWFLTPDIDNIHELRAATNCVVLDCLLPPYSEPERPCNYYRAVPAVAGSIDSSSSSSSSMWWLTTVREDSQSLPHSIEYSGIRPVMTKASAFALSNTSNSAYK